MNKGLLHIISRVAIGFVLAFMGFGIGAALVRISDMVN